MSQPPWECWRQRLEAIAVAIRRVGGEVTSFHVDVPAIPREVELVEARLGRPLPIEFRKVVLGFARRVEFRWRLPDDATLPEEFQEIFAGECGWDLDDLVHQEASRQSWVDECFPNPDDPYDRVWHRKLGWYTVTNGDSISFDTEHRRDPVVYLSHEEGDGHGYVLGDSFTDYMDRLTRLACVGAEDWQWTIFCPSASSGLDPDGPAAQRWRTWLDLKLPC